MIRMFDPLIRRALYSAIFATLFTTPSHATVFTRTFDFTATNFSSSVSPSPPPPQNTVTGSVTLTFDPAVTFSNEAKPDAISLTIAGHSYTRDEVSFQYFGPANVDKTFLIGVPGLNVIYTSTNDFSLSFIYDPVTDMPKFGYGLEYSTPFTGDGLYHSPFTTVTLGLVPEPALPLVLLSGLVAVGLVALRRRWLMGDFGSVH